MTDGTEIPATPGRDPGLVIDWIAGHCPVQAEGSVDGVPLYFRARGDRWSLSIGGRDLVGAPDWHYAEAYGTWPEAGWMREEEALGFIDTAVALYRVGAPSMDPTWRPPAGTGAGQGV